MDIVLAEGVRSLDSSRINWWRCGASYRILLVSLMISITFCPIQQFKVETHTRVRNIFLWCLPASGGNPVYMYNTITSWYTTMYHETSVIFNTQEPWARETVTTKYQDCDKGYHSHQEQYWKINKNKNIYIHFQLKPLQMFHTYTISSPSHFWTSLKKKIL